jgi:glycosyl transferase, family 25
MRCYVINLRRRPDRRAHVERTLPPGFDVVFTTDWSGPLDGQQITPESLKGFSLFPWKIESQNPYWSRPLKRGEIGCAISHWSCWKHAAESGIDRAVILEDDVLFRDGAVARLERAMRVLDSQHPQWDLLYLGRTRVDRILNLPPRFTRDIPVGDGLVRPGYSWCTRAYVLSRAGIQKVLATGFDQALIPADEFLPAMFVMHPRPDVARRFPPVLSAFALEPSIAGKLTEYATDSDTEASEFAEWDAVPDR